jgi:colicin import membrane protein
MSQQVQFKSPLSHGVLVSTVLHVGIALLLSLKPRVVTLTSSRESALMHATLVATPSNHETTGRTLNAPKTSQQLAKQPLPRVEQPPRLAAPPLLKSVNSAKSSQNTAPSKDSLTGQRVNVAKATPPSLKPATASPTKNVKLPVKGEGSTTSKSDGPAASTKVPHANAGDLDQFFGQLAVSSTTGSARGSSTQQCSHYATQIKSAIQANLIKEQGYQGRGCEIALQLAPDGTIIRAEARQGDGLVCAAALRAVGITERVPKPPDPALYELFKAIVISFEF